MEDTRPNFSGTRLGIGVAVLTPATNPVPNSAAMQHSNTDQIGLRHF